MSTKTRWIPSRCVALATGLIACAKSEPLPGPTPLRPTDASERGGAGGTPAAASGGSGGIENPTGGISSGGGGAPPIVFRDGAATSRAGRDGGAAYCATEAHQAEGRKLDLVILMDGSGSMNDEVEGNRQWDLVVNALDAFVNDPESEDIGVGLIYFGYTAYLADGGDPVASCKVGDYSKPAVPIVDLPGNASTIVNSLAAYFPLGGTPTKPALQGALDYAESWQKRYPARRVAIVMATDGEPNDCDSTVDAVSEVAAEGLAGTPSIQTYVIGVGASLTSLDQVATAGGTTQAYLVDTTQDTTARFIAAMNAIRGRAALPCEYALPKSSSGKPVDPNKVNVTFTQSTSDAGKAVLLQVADKASCDTVLGGWYYDDPSKPENIELCEASCTRAKADYAGLIEVLVGCKTETAPPPR